MSPKNSKKILNIVLLVKKNTKNCTLYTKAKKKTYSS